jgi:GT2 family glycosyltransferase
VAARFLDLEGCSAIRLSDVQQIFEASPQVWLPDPVRPVERHSMTVVICTRDRRAGLVNVLKSLALQSDRSFEVLVVDNSWDGALARCGVDGDLGDWDGLDVRYCHEPRPGLSRARNLGLAEVRTEFHAWIDDDEVADSEWVAWIKRAFASPCQPDAVGGVMLPAQLDTPAQVLFERYGGFNKGRGMQPEELRAGTPSVIHPLYPLPNFGAGGNMAFRTEALRSIGGFDNRLGAGTLTHGGEETRALSLLLEAGATVLHWPPAITWHYHRTTDEALERQFFGYSAGLTAYYASLLSTSPKYLARILSFIPRGVRKILANRGAGGSEGPPDGFPENLLRAGRKGLYSGAFLYIREAVRQRGS